LSLAAANVRPVAVGHELVCGYSSNTLLVAEKATQDGALSQLLAVLPNPAGATTARSVRGSLYRPSQTFNPPPAMPGQQLSMFHVALQLGLPPFPCPCMIHL
jgi:hypothetical protein